MIIEGNRSIQDTSINADTGATHRSVAAIIISDATRVEQALLHDAMVPVVV